ncbi:LacI family DNA-binding transcriptional regulator [Cytobacillus purgationiresistens]|uniref:LacI family transcriptional regulator n=1 Tax=Cytobacillus purgationiresistens TaxID=863449 RepID=A0ABU0AD77_9BACI|nr:LacI family DNA-binding transcriptional regulator [Cytobacillus purgationiresistens]MDQ0269198.1 LacI family transcriptional regulator [Cytobacillus purgationiresistens]
MVSSKDVAKHAGVSQTTVSRVMNTPDLVKKPTVDKVMASIDELNYIPNGHARSLVQNKTNTIALLSGPLHNPFFVDTTTAIVNYANDKGYRVNVQFVNDQKLNEAYTSAVENKVDGIIMSCILIDDPIFEKFERMDLPFITYNRKHKMNKHFVEIDNFEAGYLSAKHMLDLGHTRIAWVGGPLTVSTFNNRYEGFLHAMKDHHHQLLEEYVIHTDTSKHDITSAFKRMMSLEQSPTAFCAATDSIAMNLIDDASKENLIVPQDVSVIGIDNVDLSSHGLIQLTTVGSISEQNLGYLAICELIKMIENKKNSCVKITESVKVFNRNTTKAIQ